MVKIPYIIKMTIITVNKENALIFLPHLQNVFDIYLFAYFVKCK